MKLHDDEWIDDLLTDCRKEREAILDNWRKEAGLSNRPIGYKWDLGRRTLSVFSDRPGFLIGKGGCLFEKYENIIEEKFGYKMKIKFIELDGSIY